MNDHKISLIIAQIHVFPSGGGGECPQTVDMMDRTLSSPQDKKHKAPKYLVNIALAFLATSSAAALVLARGEY